MAKKPSEVRFPAWMNAGDAFACGNGKPSLSRLDQNALGNEVSPQSRD
jgi:hypothetical protein